MLVNVGSSAKQPLQISKRNSSKRRQLAEIAQAALDSVTRIKGHSEIATLPTRS
jgi:hypothetical protein